MNFTQIDIDETHIRLTCDLKDCDLKYYIYSIRRELKSYINQNEDFLLSLEPVKNNEEDLPEIISKMYDSSLKADVGPMACVAGSISELSLNYLMEKGSEFSIVENGGDIALVNDTKVLCGIFSNNQVLGNNIAFEIKPNRKPLGICTSSGRIGHSISFGDADSVCVMSGSSSLSDALATRIANDVCGETSEDKVSNALEVAEDYRDYFDGVLIVSDQHIGTVGKIPKIVECKEFHVRL